MTLLPMTLLIVSGQVGHRWPMTMLNCYDSRSFIYHTHNDATMHISHIIGISYLHKASRSATRVGNTLPLCEIDFGKIAKSIGEAVEWIHAFSNSFVRMTICIQTIMH